LKLSHAATGIGAIVVSPPVSNCAYAGADVAAITASVQIIFDNFMIGSCFLVNSAAPD
jgi:hypothetical protein